MAGSDLIMMPKPHNTWRGPFSPDISSVTGPWTTHEQRKFLEEKNRHYIIIHKNTLILFNTSLKWGVNVYNV